MAKTRRMGLTPSGLALTEAQGGGKAKLGTATLQSRAQALLDWPSFAVETWSPNLNGSVPSTWILPACR